MTNSPRARFGSAPSHAGSAPADIVSIVSNCFVSSRHTVIGRAGQACGERACERLDPVRRLEHDLGRAGAREFVDSTRALGAARGEEADEAEAAGGHVARRGERGQGAARAGDRHHPVPGGVGRGDELGARVAQRRRAGIAHVGDALAARQPLEHACRAARSLCSCAAISGLTMPKRCSRAAL